MDEQVTVSTPENPIMDLQPTKNVSLEELFILIKKIRKVYLSTKDILNSSQNNITDS